MAGEDDADGPTWPIDGYVDASLSAVEASLAFQRAAADEWGSVLEGRDERRTAFATPARGTAWFVDVATEAVENALVHTESTLGPQGVDLDDLETVWLHAADDAIGDVGRTPEFAATMTEAVESALEAEAAVREGRRDVLRESGLPTDRDVETVGGAILDLEYRQKSIEDDVDRLLDALATRASDEADQSGGGSGPDEADQTHVEDSANEGTDA